MKKKGVTFLTLLIIFASIYTVKVVFNSLTGSELFDLNISSLLSKNINENSKIVNIENCSRYPQIDLKDAEERHLTALKKYQEYCDSKVTEKLMIFIDMPKDNVVAGKNAEKLSVTLKEFHEYGIKPIVIVEPVTDWGLIDFNEFGQGFYDIWINTFFKELKKQGIEDEMMGMWVPFPEANLPLWNHLNASPEDFSSIVNRYLTILRKNYPNTETSILLNSATYETDDFEWINGEYVSLLPYVKGLDKNLIDSFGLQGFPWISSRGDVLGAVFNADEFLNPQIAMEAAKELGVKKIWLNTGTFGAKYTIDKESTVYVDSARRKDLLNGILSVAKLIEENGFEITVNIFSEDKSQTPEATDWSYLPESYSSDSTAFAIFSEFAAKSEASGIEISLFDRE